MGHAAELLDVELWEIEESVGERSFGRGRAYASGGRVLKLDWADDGLTLIGSVIGHGGLYETMASFADDGDGSLTFAGGDCTCPVAYNCKHVAAIVIAAATGQAGLRPAAPNGPARHLAAVSAEPEWEQPLRALIREPVTDAVGTPLAIELSLKQDRPGAGASRLIARVMRPGARGGWVNGSLTWTLDSWQVKQGGHRPDHVQLARELHAVHLAHDRPAYHYYGYGDKTLDLSDCGSQLWALLDQAARLRLPLIHATKGLGELAPYQHGEILLDVTRDAARGSAVRAVVQIDGDQSHGLEPVLFLGAEGHGLVCAEPGTGHELHGRRLQLVRLARPAPTELQRMVFSRNEVIIPDGDLERFAREICPALQRVAPVVSTDRSFTPPEVSPPSLQLRARHRDDHRLELAWEWIYQVGARTVPVPLTANGGAAGFRDPEAERELLANTVVTDTGLEHFGLLDERARPADTRPVLVSGIDSMRLTTEALPRLTALTGIPIAVEGEPPDYRDVTDSLRIGLSTADIAGERDWFDLGVTIDVDGRELPFAEVFVALASGESHMLLDDGAHFSLHDPRLQSLRQLIEEARGLSDSPGAPLRISRYQAGLWSELAALGVVTEQAQAWQRQVGGLLELGELPDHEPPPDLAAELRSYQRDGFGWLAALWELELGGILADDMGLGKTLQALALICHARVREPSAAPFLVVAPTSVVPGWAAEAARFAPQLKVEAVTDTLARSGRTVAELTAADVVITTYTLLRLESDQYRSVDWSGVILDEAQYVKNHQAKTYRCVRELPARVKLALTGTPMENNLMELWSILSITAPGLFPDPKRFTQYYQRPIERAGDRVRLERLRRRIKPLVKRRTKELVAAELPGKQEQVLTIDLHPRHRKLYDTRLQRERQKVLGLLGDFDRHRFTILRSITLLRQLSLHPGLVDDRHHDVPCAKLTMLSEHLVEVAQSGHRALVFSQFTGFLAKVRAELDQQGIGYCYLDGRTRQRKRVLERFKSGTDSVFLISLKAGGLGLNLTEADYCFLLDPWWNPAVENQAVDRAHRIGQTRPVMVYRMICAHTIEEKVVALSRRKAALFRGVMDEGDMFATSVTAEDIRQLLS